MLYCFAVLDVRLEGGETKSLVGCPSLGSPGKWVVKKVVQDVKRLAREYAASLGDPELLRRIERAMAAESETVGKRRAATAARAAAGLLDAFPNPIGGILGKPPPTEEISWNFLGESVPHA